MSRMTIFWFGAAAMIGPVVLEQSLALGQDRLPDAGYPQPATPLPGMPARPGYSGLPCEGGPVARYLNDQFARNRIYRYQQGKALRGESVYFACPPYRKAGWGYYQTCWRRSIDCNRCPPEDGFLAPVIVPEAASMQPLSVPRVD